MLVNWTAFLMFKFHQSLSSPGSHNLTLFGSQSQNLMNSFRYPLNPPLARNRFLYHVVCLSISSMLRSIMLPYVFP